MTRLEKPQMQAKVALVLGGSRGIGAAVSRRMAADGASVAIVYLNRAEVADALSSELAATGTSVLTLQADLADPKAIISAIQTTLAHFGRIDILVSVAGIAFTGAIDAYPDDAFDRTFALNVRAPFVAAKAVAAIMPVDGRIIFIGSIVADRMPGEGGTL